MPGSRRPECAVVDVHKEFIKTEVERQVFRNETALLQVLENLANARDRVRLDIEKAYFQIHKNSQLCGEDFEALKRLTLVLNVVSGRAAIKPDYGDDDETQP